MLVRWFFIFAIFTIVHSTSIGLLEEDLKNEGIDLELIHAEKEKESEEVMKEFADKDIQDEIDRLRASYPAPDNNTMEIITELEINAKVAKDLFEGDIRLTPAQWKIALDMDPNATLTRRQAITNAVYMWTPAKNPVVPYSFASHFPSESKKLVESALRFWESRTCIRFREADLNRDRDVIIFEARADGCWSNVGKIGGQQKVNLEYPGCHTFTVIAHEVSHAFGTLHVQSRSDRDEFVYIDTKNIQKGMASNFAKDPTLMGGLDNYGIPYEFGSMQHYHETAFQLNRNKPTIYAKQKYASYQKSMEGPRATFYDTLLINKVYKCTSNCKSTITCQHDGVQDGSDCNKCFCPRGWEGKHCEKRPATAKYIQVNSKITQHLEVRPGNGQFVEELFIVQAPQGKRIRAVVKSFGEYYGSMCRSFGMEIIFKRDTRMSGYRYCSMQDEAPIESETNEMLIWMYTEMDGKAYSDIEFTPF